MALDFAQVGQKKKAKKEKVTYLVRPVGEPPMIEPIQKELETYKPKLANLEKQAKDLKVVDQETFQLSIDGASTAKGLVKAIEGRKGEITSPYREFINKVNNIAKVFTEPLKRVSQEFSRKSGDYQYQQDLAQKKQEKLIAEEQAKLQKKLDAQAKKDGVEAPKVVEVKPQKPETVIHTAGGHSQHLRKQWVGEIEEGSILMQMVTELLTCLEGKKEIPQAIEYTKHIITLSNYFVWDQKLVNQAVRMGTREIPGVKIYEKVSAVHR